MSDHDATPAKDMIDFTVAFVAPTVAILAAFCSPIVFVLKLLVPIGGFLTTSVDPHLANIVLTWFGLAFFAGGAAADGVGQRMFAYWRANARSHLSSWASAVNFAIKFAGAGFFFLGLACLIWLTPH